ncbi:MAG: ATP-binding cassette domain-containing protein [Gammaproteobacteria bacterium]|nr:ATP-binding cassette domain-containing protein [Gammaproteobacteria bacterium]
MSHHPVIRVADLAFSYPDGTTALDGFSLEVHDGERVAVLGPNGAGKTTFALHLNGLHRAERGAVAVDGLELSDATLGEIRRRVGHVFQDPDDQLFMPTVAEDVGFGPANLGVTGHDLEHRVEAALAAVGMTGAAARAPHHLSGGERRRVAVATVLSMEPSILVLDEPTSNLDPASRRELVDVLQSLDQAQLVITHDLPFALELCERAVIVSGGRVVADGATAELLLDTELLHANRLELPFGFDPSSVHVGS